MALFDNPFYSDEDCTMVDKTADGWNPKRFQRQRLNNSKAYRTPFQRDLDNLTFCGAFRRLQGKTQVRQVGPQCFSRTRLSHSIEIASIARSIVSQLHILQNSPFGQFIDSDLVEFACFAHDIGNPPFGHAGERELNRQMQEHGGFEGNAQSLRIVTETAWRKGGIIPTRAGIDSILKYQELWGAKTDPPERRRKFLYDYQGELIKLLQIEPTRSIECQIMDLADDIGNALIDFTDGERAGIITPQKIKFWLDRQNENAGQFAAEDLVIAINKKVMHQFFPVRVRRCIEALEIRQISAKTKRCGYEITLTPKFRDYIHSLQMMNKEFLFTDPKIRASDNQGAFIIRTLFDIFLSHYVAKDSQTLFQNNIIPEDWHARLQRADESTKYRIICDYLSGMTDDYAKMVFGQAMEVAL
jgi:dGTPase